MIAIPALDLSGGRAVHARAGSPVTRASVPAAEIAMEFARHGFERLHLIDLDAAQGRAANDSMIREIVRSVGVDVQAGGGLHDADGVQDALDVGARWAVVAARAVPYVDHIVDLATGFPDEIVLSVSLRGRRLDTDRWPRSLPFDVFDLMEELDGLPLAALLLRAADREGHLIGPDFNLIEDAVEGAGFPILAAGGIASLAHLRLLEERGAAGAVIGTALRVGALDPSTVAAEFPT